MGKAVKAVKSEFDGKLITPILEDSSTPVFRIGSLKDNGFKQTTVWVEPELLKQVKVKMAQTERQLSDIVGELLAGWVLE